MFRIEDAIQFNGKVYELVEFLGNGAMGQVFLIQEKDGDSQLAMKTLTHFLPNDNNYRSLINEWEKAEKINHDNVIRYLGFDDGSSNNSPSPYIIMDLAHDGNLQEFLEKQIDLPEEQVCLLIFHQIINGMEAINNVIIHRDIKPENIFIDGELIKIADFGLAKVVQDKTRSKTFKGWGTLPYIAPEAFRTEKNTIQMDMYSIGHVFFQLAGLRHAFGNQEDWEHAHLTMIAPAVNSINPSISPKVADVINKLIEKRPSDRYKTWSEVRQDLLASSKNVGNNKNIVNMLLQKKLNREMSKKETITKQQNELDKVQRRRSILSYQFEKSIKKPIVELVDQLNATLRPNEVIRLAEQISSGSHTLRIPFNGKEVNIWFSELNESDFMEYPDTTIWGDKVMKTIKPTIRGRLVTAWGAIEASNGKGLNLVLVETKEDDDEYGEWFVLENSNTGLGRSNLQRQTPFAFIRQELKKEIYNVGVMHTYNISIKPLTDELLTDFFVQSF